MSLHQDPGGRPFTGRHMLFIMLAFFGLILGVNVTMAYFAAGSWPGLVVQNSYVASQEFNGKLRDAAHQADLGWSGDLSYEAGSLSFGLRDRQGKSIGISAVTAKLGRPSTIDQDVRLALKPVAGGQVRADHTLAPGQWFADIEVLTLNGEIWRKRWRLYVEAGRP
jgi:nitrogen fixation protein FixH